MVKLYELNNYKKLIAVGDIHGDFKTFANKIYSKSLNNTLFIVCGDCGFGFNKFEYYNIELTKLSKKLITKNNGIIFIRGNHDDPSYFENELINFDNIKTIPDYSVIHTCDKYILCVGGAISIDRKWRLQQEIILNIHNPNKATHKKIYWDNEQVVYDEDKLNEIAEAKLPISIVCTHSAPSFCPPKDKNDIEAWLIQDNELEKDLEIERGNLDKLFEFCKKNFNINKWAYAHFHKLDFDDEGSFNYDDVMFQMMRMVTSNNYSFHIWMLANVIGSDNEKICASDLAVVPFNFAPMDEA